MTWLEDQIHTIREDCKSGSLELLSQIISAFETYLQDEDKGDMGLEQWEKTIHKVSNMFHPFPVIQHFFSFMAGGDSVRLEILKSRLREYQLEWAQIDRMVAERALDLLDTEGKTFLVHSHSQTLKTFFKLLSERSVYVSIFQTESRPMLEGRDQAIELDRFGHQVILITEAQAADAIPGVDMILSGADRVYPDGFINKVGTLNLAILAQYFEKPFYVLYDGRKWIDQKAGSSFEQEQHRPDEIWDQPIGHIQIVNDYFEYIPDRLVKNFISESKVHPV